MPFVEVTEMAELEDFLGRLYEQLLPNFNPSLLGDLANHGPLIIQFRFDSDDPFCLTIDGSDFLFKSGESHAPTITLFLDNRHSCAELLTGAADGMQQFMKGKYRADGNIVLSQLLLYVFRSMPSLSDIRD